MYVKLLRNFIAVCIFILLFGGGIIHGLSNCAITNNFLNCKETTRYQWNSMLSLYDKHNYNSHHPIEIFQTELAGVFLTTYPFFHYVKNFNENETIRVAIDPFQFSEVQNKSVDIYIVTSKNKSEWKVDLSLSDVRSSGFQTEFLEGSTIQDYTYIVAEPYELLSQNGFGLGVGYDVVFDFDHNGELSYHDFIDGYSNEAGFYVVHDTSAPGPLDVSVLEYSGGEWLTQRVYYPTTIEKMGQLPLIVINHGWLLQYTFYDHIGYHLASYGYIVMAHTNDVGNGDWPGTESASTTLLQNTDYILELSLKPNPSAFPAKILHGHLDKNNIVWIGHSTGGEAVVRAYTRIRSGSYIPKHFGYENIALISSIAPVSWMPKFYVNPYDGNYHMFIGASDTDCTGAPIEGYVQSMAIFERSYGNRQLIYIHGAGHCDFDDGIWGSWATGPDLIGRNATHKIVKGYYLPLVEWYTKNNLAAEDFFKRMYDDFHPMGIPSNVKIAIEYKDAQNAEKVVIDDYQTEYNLSQSSSGGVVRFNIQNPCEVFMKDVDQSFYWTGTQPSNGMTRSRYDDDPRCIVFDWTIGDSKYYEFEVIPSYQDFTKYKYLSFRVCQGTRHPETDALEAPLNFSVSLKDCNNNSSSINFGSYGQITRPYLRNGYGLGAGWGNEFSSVRICLHDFTINGTAIDLSNIVAIRFNFGSAFGSERGRIGIDDVEITDII